MSERTIDVEGRRRIARTARLMDPGTFEARMQYRRETRQWKRDMSYLVNFTIALVGACLAALCVIGVVWGVS